MNILHKPLALQGPGRIMLYRSPVVFLFSAVVYSCLCLSVCVRARVYMCAARKAMGWMLQLQVPAVYDLCIAEIYNSLQWLMEGGLYACLSAAIKDSLSALQSNLLAAVQWALDRNLWRAFHIRALFLLSCPCSGNWISA